MWRFTRSRVESEVTSSPLSRILPRLARSTPAMAFSVVVLPAPFEPMMQVTLPAATASEMPQMTCVAP